jgi:hypothetical protein
MPGNGSFLAALVLLGSFCVFGQNPRATSIADNPRNQAVAATRIGSHRMGESFWAWYSIMSGHPESADGPEGNIAALCKGQKRMDRIAKAQCKTVSEIQASGQGEFGTSVDNRVYTWRFFGGKVSELSITPELFAQRSEDRRLDFQQELAFLTQTYGQPSELRAVPYRNAYGAEWTRSIATWNMPGGTTIFEFEKRDFDRGGDVLAINFFSKEAASRQLNQGKPKPYE